MEEKTFRPFTKKKKIGYALGIFTDSLLYNMFYTYFLTFLIQIVGIKPAVSGAVVFVSIAWDAVTDPIIGAYTDRAGVDKRKVMKRAILPLAIVYMLSWLNWKNIAGITSMGVTVLIYIVLTMSIWLFYTLYTIPYYSVVAEITEDYDERTSIRSLASLLNALAIALGNVLPALVATVVFSHAITYFDVSVIMSFMAAVLGFVCVASLKGIFLAKAEKPPVKVKKSQALSDTFRGFRDMLKIRSFRLFMLFVFLFLFATAMIQSNFSYTVVYCIGLEYDTGIIIVVATLVVTIAAVTPISEKLAKRKDKRFSCLVFVFICAVCLLIIKLLGLDFCIGGLHIMAVMLPFSAAIGLGAFWTLFYAMAYDFVEIDEFISGERRESLITAFPQFIQKMGSGCGIFAQGILLTLYGYEKSASDYDNVFAAITDAKIINGMTNITTIFPAVLLILSLIGVILLPTTREKMELLSQKLEKRRAGEEVTSEGIEALVR